jgi:hypothetical protein
MGMRRRSSVFAHPALALLALAASAAPARADGSETSSPAAASVPVAPQLEPERHWFRTYLGAAYAAPIAIGLVAASVSRTDRGTGEGIGYVALASLALPAVVRIAEGASADLPTGLLGTLGATAGGAIAGLFIGGVLCNKEIDGDCIGVPIEGAAIGLLAGYASWAIIDSVFLAYTETPRTHAARISEPRLALTPFVLPLLREPTLAAPSVLHGFSAGILARF